MSIKINTVCPVCFSHHAYQYCLPSVLQIPVPRQQQYTISQLLVVEVDRRYNQVMAMAFIYTSIGPHIWAYVLLFYFLNIFGRDSNGNVTSTDSFSDSVVDRISKNSFAVEHGVIHVNDNDIDDSTTNNECITTFLSSATNETIVDFVEDDSQRYTTATTVTSHDDHERPSTGSHVITMKMTHMNIGFGEIQMIQHDREATQKRLIETLLYMYNNHTSSMTTTTSGAQVECTMQHELCAYWAASGECEVRPGTYKI